MVAARLPDRSESCWRYDLVIANCADEGMGEVVGGSGGDVGRGRRVAGDGGS